MIIRSGEGPAPEPGRRRVAITPDGVATIHIALTTLGCPLQAEIRRRIAERLVHAQSTAALLTTFNDVDMSAVIEARDKYKDLFAKKHDIRLGFMGFFAKAACLALKDVPADPGVAELALATGSAGCGADSAR